MTEQNGRGEAAGDRPSPLCSGEQNSRGRTDGTLQVNPGTRLTTFRATARVTPTVGDSFSKKIFSNEWGFGVEVGVNMGVVKVPGRRYGDLFYYFLKAGWITNQVFFE